MLRHTHKHTIINKLMALAFLFFNLMFIFSQSSQASVLQHYFGSTNTEMQNHQPDVDEVCFIKKIKTVGIASSVCKKNSFHALSNDSSVSNNEQLYWTLRSHNAQPAPEILPSYYTLLFLYHLF